MKYAYPARFCKEADRRYTVYFVDMELSTSGDTLADAAYMAQDALKVWISGALEDGDPLPAPSDPLLIRPQSADEFISLVYAEAGATETPEEEIAA
jgi:predicted RNase H-like HicB family nuclease